MTPKFLLRIGLGLLLVLIPVNLAAKEKPEYDEKVYLNEAQALKLVFKDLRIEKKQMTLTASQKNQIQKRLRRKLEESQFTFYIGKKQERPEMYALILNENGKHFPMTFIVALNTKAVVQQVAIMVYREKRGDAVKRSRFLNQFNNKSSHDPIEVNTDIVHLTGATISSWAVAAGVKKAVVVTEEVMVKATP